jgi:hypothetical protein
VKRKQTALGFVLTVAVLLVAVALLWWAMGIAVKLLGWGFGLLPTIVAAIGIVSCVMSPAQKTNVKLLWIIIIVLAPLLGTLLWFLWGKKNT